MSEFDVFLSHNSKDKPVVRELAEALRSRGLKVWLDEWELVPGRPWQSALEEIIKTVNSTAVLIGKDGLGPWEEPEMRAAIDQFIKRKSPVIPVLLPDAPEEPELPLFLTGFTWVDFRREAITEKTLNQLVWGITGHKLAISGEPTERDRLDELTTYARHRIAEVASQWLSQECDPFVMPALSRRVSPHDTMAARRETVPWEPLSDDACRSLVVGSLPKEKNRVRVFSQSGMGKTTLLHYCEQQIAEAEDGRVPIRVSALSNYDWRGDVLTTLANRVLHPFLPTDTDEVTRNQWLRQLIREHRVVFLFDAVDQTHDELAGLSPFLQSADVCNCPAILTGRPEVEQTCAGVFSEATWETVRVEPFDEQRIREYLGDISDKMLPIENEAWEDRPSYERKKHWSDLLQVPLLLRLMRRLASEESEPLTKVTLNELHNRHAIYREAVRHLVDQGRASLSWTPHREDLLDHAEVNEYLSEMAWEMVAEDNFTSVFQGEPFQRWRAQNRKAVRALEQVDLTTRYSLLDNPGELGLAWRHLSFCEFFAGMRLAHMERAEQESVVQSHGRKPSWKWVFRFALSELEAEGHEDDCNELARDLIRFGNPFLVYDAIRGDGLKLPEKLDTLCRWLVHRGDFGYDEAWKPDTPRPEVDCEVLSVLAALFERPYRDSRCLHPAWEMLTSSSDSVAKVIQTTFLAEFAEFAASSGTNKTVAQSLSLDEHFLQCPPAGKENQTFKIGKDAEQSVKIAPFYLGKAPITNVQFELFDPSHKQLPGQYSPDNDSPALYVHWYMAVMFCIWLGEGHRLPTEEEWEVACRAGTTTEYWWGDGFDGEKCNAKGNQRRAMAADPAHANDWGFMEMCGNVWEWCSDSRVFRGGAWSVSAVDCRCCSRYAYHPLSRQPLLGFRVARDYP